jgi:hypothetical protein
MMQVLRCKCGAKAIFLEGENFDCMGCDICLTTYASEGEHRLRQPHKWSIVFDDQSGTIYRCCSVCRMEDKLVI